ncbi:carbon-nitrogen hydrolase family protein [Rhizobium multihospitium]|uniref:Aliphatic nitrilase n=1 Tax=Rhizobium multihospitium TaxID=410764 RepID=A0A1C3XDR2_9HYPH|nr:carbon-nitrogen hydrolase family protein [Rhizobium multihospitium]SCB50437.1 aliphatic nitrilase [Rhizobium multihospitium]
MVSYTSTFKAAAVQAEPVWLDADATIEKAIKIMDEAASNGAQLIAFPEVFIPGYPFWAWMGDQKWGLKFLLKYHENSLELGDERMRRLQVAARRNNIALVMGYSERDAGSRYISQVFIDEHGQIVANRRKLKPTHVERSVFGEGNGSDILTHDFSFGRVGGLNCWEHMQPLTKYVMFSLDEQVHVASWPPMSVFQPDIVQLSVEANATVTRSYAIEGQVFVVGATQVIGPSAVEVFCDTEERQAMLPLGGGWARMYGPDGSELAKPLAQDAEGILYADIDLSHILYAKAAADPTGHYARADVLSLNFDPRNHTPVRYVGADGRSEIEARSRVENFRLKQLSEQHRVNELSAVGQIGSIPITREHVPMLAAVPVIGAEGR